MGPAAPPGPSPKNELSVEHVSFNPESTTTMLVRPENVAFSAKAHCSLSANEGLLLDEFIHNVKATQGICSSITNFQYA